jgi:hypothetical protein
MTASGSITDSKITALLARATKKCHHCAVGDPHIDCPSVAEKKEIAELLRGPEQGRMIAKVTFASDL